MAKMAKIDFRVSLSSLYSLRTRLYLNYQNERCLNPEAAFLILEKQKSENIDDISLEDTKSHQIPYVKGSQI